MKKKIAVFPGSFDPFTLGHHDIVIKSLKLFDEVIIGIGRNSSKKRYFDLEELTPKIRDSFKDVPNVKVMAYEGLTSDFARAMNAAFLIRGIRNTTDFEYEKSIAEANKVLVHDLDTIFLITKPELAFISSSIIRDIHRHGKDINPFLPYKI